MIVLLAERKLKLTTNQVIFVLQKIFLRKVCTLPFLNYLNLPQAILNTSRIHSGLRQECNTIHLGNSALKGGRGNWTRCSSMWHTSFDRHAEAAVSLLWHVEPFEGFCVWSRVFYKHDTSSSSRHAADSVLSFSSDSVMTVIIGRLTHMSCWFVLKEWAGLGAQQM